MFPQNKVVIQGAKHFADKSEIQVLDLDDAIGVNRALKTHHIGRVDNETVHIYFNSNYKLPSDKNVTLTFDNQSQLIKHCSVTRSVKSEN